jgi:hypothetical protein
MVSRSLLLSITCLAMLSLQMLEQAESILAAVEEMPGLTRMDGNSHKCHFVSVLFKLFGQVDRYT